MPKRRTFIKQIGTGALAVGFIPVLNSCNQTHPTTITSVETSDLPRSTPEEQGVSSQSLLNLYAEIEKSGIEFHSLMIIRHGKVITEGWWSPFASELKHTLYSLSKSFTSTAVGLAVSEGLLMVNDKVVSFFPDDTPDGISERLASMEVRHLLTMNTGHGTGTMDGMRVEPDGNWPKAFLAQELEHDPGTQFLYNTGATYMLSNIVQKLTGKTLIEYLTPRLFVPLGIEGADWETCPRGVNTGGYGLRVRTEDIAKLGLLYLQKGKWNETELLPESWDDEATKYQVPSQEDNGD
ncbi:MAG: serine hydrolase [Bacteroidetes bacterium]|nr:serine hydrolase [Bacteroidota bacterium]MDA1119826.1 serine hydrolase [Bacteroidota bacterium]